MVGVGGSRCYYYYVTTSSSSSLPWCKCNNPISSLSFLCNRNRNRNLEQLQLQPQRLVAASVAFNPQGNYDISLLDDDPSASAPAPAPTPLPPTQGRFEVVLDTHAIRRLHLQPFHSATSISSPSHGITFSFVHSYLLYSEYAFIYPYSIFNIHSGTQGVYGAYHWIYH